MRGARATGVAPPAFVGRWPFVFGCSHHSPPLHLSELHELRVKAEKDKADEASLKKSMAKIEADAKAKFEADKAAAAAAQRALGTWVSWRRERARGGERAGLGLRPAARILWEAVAGLSTTPSE